MPARNNASYVAADLSRDTGFIGATVHINPKKWSSRRRNIVLRALNDGLTACGHETAHFIDCLTQAYGGRVQTMTKWNDHITVDCVKEEEVENLIAYTCAWIRLKLANEPAANGSGSYFFNSRLRDWVGAVSGGERPNTIPAPDISNGEKVAFVKQYLKDDDETKTLRQSLARMIEQGEILSINVKAA
jgi:hypothetical protein